MYTLSRKFPLFSHFVYRQGINRSDCFCHLDPVHRCGCNASGVTGALSAGVDSFYIGSELFGSRTIRTGEEVRLSTPSSNASGRSKPESFFQSMDSCFNGIADLFWENTADIGKCISSFDTGDHISKPGTFLMGTVIFEKLYRNFPFPASQAARSSFRCRAIPPRTPSSGKSEGFTVTMIALLALWLSRA